MPISECRGGDIGHSLRLAAHLHAHEQCLLTSYALRHSSTSFYIMVTPLEPPSTSSTDLRIQAEAGSITLVMETKSPIYPSSTTLEEAQRGPECDRIVSSAWRRVNTNIERNFPINYHRLRRVLLWLRGPRPRVYLPGESLSFLQGATLNSIYRPQTIPFFKSMPQRGPCKTFTGANPLTVY